MTNFAVGWASAIGAARSKRLASVAEGCPFLTPVPKTMIALTGAMFWFLI